MKFSLFLVIVNGAEPTQDSWWAIDGNLTKADCQRELVLKEHHLRALYGGPAVAYLTCDVDHSPDEW